MSVVRRLLVGIGVTCIVFGIILIGVSMLTGGGQAAVISHGIVPAYLEEVYGHFMAIYNQIYSSIQAMFL